MFPQITVMLVLHAFLVVGNNNQQMITVRPILFRAHTTTPTPNNDRQGNKTSNIQTVKARPKQHKCGIKMQAGCSCSKETGTFSISCDEGYLGSVPQFNIGPVLVRTLNLKNNNLTSVKIGDFFGLKIENLNLANNCLVRLEFLAFWGLEYTLETLDMSHNAFRRVPSAALRLLRHVKTLKLSANRIGLLRNYDFSSLQKLQMLFLDGNPIKVVDRQAFHGCHPFLLNMNRLSLAAGLSSIPTADFGQLQRLRLAENGISEIPEGWFKNLTALRFLDLEGNLLYDIELGAFTGADKMLRKLNLKQNKLRRIPTKALRGLTELDTLDLSMNKIKKVRAWSFNSSQNLQALKLDQNRIQELHKNSLRGLDNSKMIDLRDNRLRSLDSWVFYWDDLADRQIYLQNNPWLCNCLLKWMKQEYKKRTPLSRILPDLPSLICQFPEYMEGEVIVRLPPSEFTCDHDYYDYDYYYDVELYNDYSDDAQ